MSTSTPESPKVAHQISESRINQLLDSEMKISDHQPLVVFISDCPDREEIASKLSVPSFQCSSVHEFLRLGLNHRACVLVVSEQRAECSFENLQELLKRRAHHPIEVVSFNHSNNQLVHLSEKIEQSVTQLTEIQLVDPRLSHSNRGKFSDSGTIANRVIHKEEENENSPNDRMNEGIHSKPEEYLRQAISKIRQPSN